MSEPAVDFAAAHSGGLLDRHVTRRADRKASQRVGGGLAHFGDTKIDDFDEGLAFVVVGEEDVVGLEIAVDDAEFVGGVEAAGGLLQNLGHRVEWQRATTL